MMAYTTTGLETQAGPKSQDCFLIFLHALNSGLLRVKLQGPSGRSANQNICINNKSNEGI